MQTQLFIVLNNIHKTWISKYGSTYQPTQVKIQRKTLLSIHWNSMILSSAICIFSFEHLSLHLASCCLISTEVLAIYILFLDLKPKWHLGALWSILSTILLKMLIKRHTGRSLVAKHLWMKVRKAKECVFLPIGRPHFTNSLINVLGKCDTVHAYNRVCIETKYNI